MAGYSWPCVAPSRAAAGYSRQSITTIQSLAGPKPYSYRNASSPSASNSHAAARTDSGEVTSATFIRRSFATRGAYPSARGNGGALNIRRRDPARAARRARRGGRDQHALPTRHRPYRVGRNDGRDRAKRTTVLSAAERNYAPKLTRAQKRVPPACKRCWQATVHLSMSRTFRVAELPGGAPRLSDFADVCWPRWPQIGLSGLFSAWHA